MPTVVQIRRGTTAENNNFIGQSGELTVDTSTWSLRVHDSITPGGHAITGGVTGVLSVAQGGTGTINPVITNTAPISVTGTWPNVNISLSGLISVAKGGTGTDTPTPNATAPLSLSGTWPNVTVALTGTVGTVNGGTGLTAFTTNGALYATSTSALTTGTLPVNSGGTGVTTSTGTGSVVLSTSPILVTPAITGGATVAGGTAFTGGVQIDALGVGIAAGSAGTIKASDNIFAYATSDRKHKKDIVTLTDALTKVQNLTGVEFNWTDEYLDSHGGADGFFLQQHDVGVIAQEVQQVLPEAVRTRENGDLAVDYQRLVPLLIEAVKQLTAEVNILKAR